jgi:hypothetical protein
MRPPRSGAPRRWPAEANAGAVAFWRREVPIKIIDPETKAPAKKNPFFHPKPGVLLVEDMAIDRLLAKGGVFGGCNVALQVQSKMLASNAGVSAEEAAEGSLPTPMCEGQSRPSLLEQETTMLRKSMIVLAALTSIGTAALSTTSASAFGGDHRGFGGYHSGWNYWNGYQGGWNHSGKFSQLRLL